MADELKWRSLSRETVQTALKNEITIKSGNYYLIKFFNQHITEAVLDELISKANNRSRNLIIDDFPIDVPLFHTRSPAKGGKSFYGQMKVGGLNGIYVHHVSALFNFFEGEEGKTAKTGAEVPVRNEPQASHLLQGYPLASRDFNPRNVVFEAGIVNRSRWFCNLLMAGLLKDRFKLDANEEEMALAMGGSQNLPCFGELEEAEDLDETGAFATIAAGFAMASQQTEQPKPWTYAEAHDELHKSCRLVHGDYPCRFYDPSNLSPASAWCGDSRKNLATPQQREDAAQLISDAIKSFLPAYSAILKSPSPLKRRRVSQAAP